MPQTTIHIFAKFSDGVNAGHLRYTAQPAEAQDDEEFIGYTVLPFDPFERGLTQDELIKTVDAVGIVNVQQMYQLKRRLVDLQLLPADSLERKAEDYLESL